MFKEEINLKKKNDVRYGTTKINATRTSNEIMDLLDEHGCSKVATYREDKKTVIAFEYQDKTYSITVPRVYIKGDYNEKIGIRIVKYYLEIILDWAKNRVIDFEFMMLPNRTVNYDGKQYRFGDLVDKLPDGKLTSPLDDVDKLPESKDGQVKEAEYEEV